MPGVNPDPLASFQVIPSIDLKDGRVVRLLRGDMRQATVYSDDPASVAREFEREGAKMIHVVDLDGAIEGEPRNLKGLGAIRAAARRSSIDVSGGLRTLDHIKRVFDSGADRVALGSAILLEPSLIESACGLFPDRVFGSIDGRGGRLAIKGWTELSSLGIAEAANRFREYGAAALIYTDVSRDGTTLGSDIPGFASLALSAKLRVIASGGVGSLQDIRALSSHFDHGVVGAITGRAIYEKIFTLAAAIQASQNRA
ncbi:MAG TPA: HisA/HisF-related TIM barrel protein [Candidatus Binataceae bacterium]